MHHKWHRPYRWCCRWKERLNCTPLRMKVNGDMGSCLPWYVHQTMSCHLAPFLTTAETVSVTVSYQSRVYPNLAFHPRFPTCAPRTGSVNITCNLFFMLVLSLPPPGVMHQTLWRRAQQSVSSKHSRGFRCMLRFKTRCSRNPLLFFWWCPTFLLINTV